MGSVFAPEPRNRIIRSSEKGRGKFCSGSLYSVSFSSTRLYLMCEPIGRFTTAELRALLAVAPEEWRTLILTGYFLGGRLSDMVSLGWDNVDLSGRVVIYTQAKTNRRVE